MQWTKTWGHKSTQTYARTKSQGMPTPKPKERKPPLYKTDTCDITLDNPSHFCYRMWSVHSRWVVLWCEVLVLCCPVGPPSCLDQPWHPPSLALWAAATGRIRQLFICPRSNTIRLLRPPIYYIRVKKKTRHLYHIMLYVYIFIISCLGSSPASGVGGEDSADLIQTRTSEPPWTTKLVGWTPLMNFGQNAIAAYCTGHCWEKMREAEWHISGNAVPLCIKSFYTFAAHKLNMNWVTIAMSMRAMPTTGFTTTWTKSNLRNGPILSPCNSRDPSWIG